ncbi:pilus assembly protein TadG-related protein [Demequina oxidasica]|uniref:pilus assembly protein TadG-related protein n=1 Tax=Demequina oxidasica TaxID=676199 RepID=UPI0007831A4B|nr:hypothetical protein [Demequina oxidasica]
MRLRDDSGAGTLLAIAVLAVVGLVAVFAGGLAGASVAQVRAQGVADLAALAAARAARDALATRDLASGNVDACQVAARVARENGSRTRLCVVDARGAVRVEISVATRWGDARGSSRAGPRGAG